MEHSSKTDKFIAEQGEGNARTAVSIALYEIDILKSQRNEIEDKLKEARDVLSTTLAAIAAEKDPKSDWQEKSRRVIQETEAWTSRLLATKIISDWSGKTSEVLLEALTEIHAVAATVFPPENEKVPRLWRKAIEKARAAINQAEIFQNITQEEKAALVREESRLLASAKKLARYMGWQGQETAEMRVIADFLEAIAEKEAETAATKNQPANFQPANQEMHIALIEILSEAKNLYNRPRKFMAACQKGYRALATYSATCQENGNEDLPLEEWAKESGDASAIGGGDELEIWPPLPIP